MPWYTEKIGPLPAGAWIALVGGGLVITYTLNRRRGAAPQVSTGTDTATGETQAPLQATGFGTLVPAAVTVVPTSPTTNEEWVTRAVDAMVVANPTTDPAAASDALTAYIHGQGLTPAQVAYVTLAQALIGRPPLPLPTGPSGQPGPSPTPQPRPSTRHHYVTEFHRISVRTSGRALVQRFSDASVATANNVETALRLTTADPRNARWMPYYIGNRGYFQAGAAIYLHVVKAG